MKRKAIHLIGATTLSILAATACGPPDRASEDSRVCTSGVSSFSIDDSGVPAAVKDEIYDSGRIRGVDDPMYRPDPQIVIIPVGFPELPHNPDASTEVIREAFFGTGNGSIKDFFFESSWGQLVLDEAVIAEPVSLTKTREEYADENGHPDWTRAADVARDAAVMSSVNWQALDEDANGMVDRREAQVVFLISGGRGGATRPNSVILSTNGGLFTLDQKFVYVDAKRADDPARDVDTISYNYSTIWHELAHAMLDLPDRYDSYCGTGGTGEFDLMSDNCQRTDMNLHDKMKIGWVRPPVLVGVSDRADESRHCYAISASEEVPAGIVLADPDNPGEYWVVENRHKPSSLYDFDRGLPESGLAVWWVRTSTDGSHDEIRLVDAAQSDAAPTTYEDQDAGALFRSRPGDPLDPGEMTRMLFYDDMTPGFAIRGVSDSGPVMYAEL